MRSRDVAEASLSVLHNNARAIALYRRLGLTEARHFVGKKTGVTYLKMTKKL